ncbi:hypothetical protein ACTFIR_003643 [Dictyostelium discoideum]
MSRMKRSPKLFLLLSFICLLNLIKGDCKTCIDQGEKCYKESFDQYYWTYSYKKIGECKNGLVCGPKDKNSNLIDYICKPVSNFGQTCSKDFECNIGLVCLNNVCSNSRFSAIGEPCSNTYDCEGTNSYCSIEGVCSGPVICKSDIDCKYGYYCTSSSSSSSKYCTIQPTLGQPCYFNGFTDYCLNSTCQNSYSSSSSSYYYGSCQYPILKTFGKPCSNSYECDYTNNLYCSSYSNICEYYTKMIKEPINGNCSNVTGIGSSQVLIKGNTCDDAFDCSCIDGECHQSDLLPMQISNIVNPLVNCLHSHACKLIVNNSYSLNSCASRNCANEMCKYLKASYDINSIDNNSNNPLQCGNTEFIINYCDSVGSNSSSINYNHKFKLILIIIIIIFSFL